MYLTLQKSLLDWGITILKIKSKVVLFYGTATCILIWSPPPPRYRDPLTNDQSVAGVGTRLHLPIFLCHDNFKKYTSIAHRQLYQFEFAIKSILSLIVNSSPSDICCLWYCYKNKRIYKINEKKDYRYKTMNRVFDLVWL